MTITNSSACICRCSANGMNIAKPQGANRDPVLLAQFADLLSAALTGQMPGYPVNRAYSPINTYPAASYGYPMSLGASAYGIPSSTYGSTLKNSLLMSALSGGMQSNSFMQPGLLRYSALAGNSGKS